jgi:hypothetical protein
MAAQIDAASRSRGSSPAGLGAARAQLQGLGQARPIATGAGGGGRGGRGGRRPLPLAGSQRHPAGGELGLDPGHARPVAERPVGQLGGPVRLIAGQHPGKARQRGHQALEVAG